MLSSKQNKLAFHLMNYIKLTLGLICLTLFAILFLDKLIALWLNEHLHHHNINATSLKGVSWLYDVLTSELSLVLFVLVILMIVSLEFRNLFSKRRLFVLICYQITGLMCLNYIKSLLKYLFGRCVPDVCFLPWYIEQGNQYGFAWLSKVSGFASFPSGHCAFMSFCIFWVIALRSSLRLVMSCLFGLLFCGLVLFNYHFLGDCLAGSALGVLFASCCYWLWCRAID